MKGFYFIGVIKNQMDLRRLARTCNFGAAEKEMLRDRIVIGTSNKRLQTKLLDTPELTYDLAIQKARTCEATEEQSSALLESKHVDVVTRGQRKNNNNNRRNENRMEFSNGQSNNNNKTNQK